ncbi:hypothetical protein CMU93_12950 [Elizabethkingia anophelis]|nr:hypothetical protein [Elizabethkingia anophelis]
MKNDISFLVGLKNNLTYTIFFYDNVRKVYPDIELVFVSYGSTDGTNEWLDQLEDENVQYFYSHETKTLSDTYNKATLIATKKNVCFLHNDMVLGQKFVENLMQGLEENHITCYKVVEPPIFTEDNRDWKIVEDYGDGIDTFKEKAFVEFEKKYISDCEISQSFTNHTSFFLCIERDSLLKIGGLDSLFNPMFYEDDDLILRLKLLGFKTKLIHNALVYHFVSKTSRFSLDYQEKTKEIEVKSCRNFYRKWGFSNSSKANTRYDIGIVLNKGSKDSLNYLEPFASVIYIDFPMDDYINEEQINTKYDLKTRIKSISEMKQHDVMVYIEGNKMNNKTKNNIANLSEIISDNKKSFLNPNFLVKLFYKIFKPNKPLVFYKVPERKEKLLIYKELEVC